MLENMLQTVFFFQRCDPRLISSKTSFKNSPSLPSLTKSLVIKTTPAFCKGKQSTTLFCYTSFSWNVFCSPMHAVQGLLVVLAAFLHKVVLTFSKIHLGPCKFVVTLYKRSLTWIA